MRLVWPRCVKIFLSCTGGFHHTMHVAQYLSWLCGCSTKMSHDRQHVPVSPHSFAGARERGIAGGVWGQHWASKGTVFSHWRSRKGNGAAQVLRQMEYVRTPLAWNKHAKQLDVWTCKVNETKNVQNISLRKIKHFDVWSSWIIAPFL